VKEDADPSRYRLKVSLRLWHKEPRNLGDMLRGWGLEVGPDWRAGEIGLAPNGKPMPGLRSRSYASAKLALPSSGTLENAISLVLDGLEAARSELRAFVDEGGTAELFVFWDLEANSGGTVGWKLAQRLADFRLNLALDVYP
jgi:hypothetical protein